LDTVPASDNWSTNPFEAVIKGKSIYGLGTCDMKGGISAFLMAIQSIKKEKLRNGLKLYFTFDEEISFRGIEQLLKKDKEITKYLILAEPTNLFPVIATKGLMDIEVKFLGKSVHSSVLNKGKNAIVEAIKFTDELLELAKILEVERNEIFDIPYATINIGQINGGTAVNVVPNECNLLFDIRTVNDNQNKILETKIKEMLKSYDAGLSIRVNITAKTNSNNEMIEKMEQITQNKAKAVNYVTEASFLRNTDTVILGVGGITAHEANEHIEIDKLQKLVEIYKRIIEEYCYKERE
ncbi:MAG: M20/M25/M40 family metallo-hydrolase, partial [Lachnospiraceae bacterium]|nr:M20/M25/M40 family metallo-hydrolase [Lachnospiraceae bacterium]